MDNETTSCRATLTRGSDGAEQHCSQGKVQISSLGHDQSVVAAQFQKGTTKTARHSFGDRPSHPGRPGRRNEWYAGVSREQAANGGTAHDQAPERGIDTGIQANLLCDPDASN